MDATGEKHTKSIKPSLRKTYIGGVEIFMLRGIYWGNLDCYAWHAGFFLQMKKCKTCPFFFFCAQNAGMEVLSSLVTCALSVGLATSLALDTPPDLYCKFVLFCFIIFSQLCICFSPSIYRTHLYGLYKEFQRHRA